MKPEKTPEKWSYTDMYGVRIVVEIVRFEGLQTRVRRPDGIEILIGTANLSRLGKRRTK